MATLAASFGLSLFVHVCLFLLMLLAQRELPQEASAASCPRELISRFLVNAPARGPRYSRPKKEPATSVDKGGLREKDEGGGKKDKGDEGKVGKKEAKQQETEIAGENRGAIAAKVRGMGLLGALAGGDTLKDALNVASVGNCSAA